MKLSNFYLSYSYLEEHYIKHKNEIIKKKEEIAKRLDREYLYRFLEFYDKLPQKAKKIDLLNNVITIGDPDEIDFETYKILFQQLKLLIPWRKGPWNYFGIYVDSEWRSDFKWNRILPHIKDELKGSKVADIGANNTYYMYKTLAYEPELVIGFDPIEKYLINYLMNQRFINASNIYYELLGVEDVDLYDNFFDIVYFMGVLYHRRDPVASLQKIHKCLKNDGLLILESLGIDMKGSFFLFPPDRYMKAKGYWFIPTIESLVNLLKRTKFYDIEVFLVTKLTVNEQRSTPWVGTESLEHFLDPLDETRTVEGLPAPYRIYIKARKDYNRQIHYFKS